MECIELRAFNQHLSVVPDLGAAISRYAYLKQDQWVDILRPATEAAIEQGLISEMSSFVMAPWAGRIQNGRFTYQDQEIYYPSAIEGYPHSMHGFVRDSAWHIMAQTQSSLSLQFIHHTDDKWPFSFELIQTYELKENGLLIELSVSNIGESMMPFSMGHHPFFPCNQQTKLYVNVQKAWYNDDLMMPTYLDVHPMVRQLAQGYPVQEQAWDTIFTGWDRQVLIDWGSHRVRYQVSSPMDFFVLYNPAGESWFCAEPFGNITDSFNLRNQFPRELIGGMDIAPGERLKTRFELFIEAT